MEVVIDAALPQYDLAGEAFAPFFKKVCVTQRTGLLKVNDGHTERAVHVRAGRPVFASSTHRDERLNGFLLRLGLVSLPDMVGAVERMLKENRRLGEILVDMGLLEEEHVRDALRIQIREIICSMLTVSRGQFSFVSQKVAKHSEIGFGLPPNALIREALFRIQGFHRVMDEIGGLSAVYQISEGFELEVKTAGLAPQHLELVPLFREPQTLQQACTASELNDYEICQVVWVLLAIGALHRQE